MIFSYARVSTNGQARNGNSLEAQICTFQNASAEKIFSDFERDMIIQHTQEGESYRSSKSKLP